jgi:hypothetical protein
MRLPLYMARDSQRALDLLFRDCENDAKCNQRFPRIRQRLNTLLEGLSTHPQRVRMVHPRTGAEKEIDVKRLTLTGILFGTLYAPASAALVPLLIEQAEKGNYTGFYAFGAAMDPTASTIAQGMHFSVVCSEDAARIGPGAIAREAAGTFAGAEMAELRLQPCGFWPRAQVEPAYYDTPPTSVPALASRWKNSRHIVVPATGHGTWASGCVMKLMAQFLNDATAANLDATCVQRVKRPPFFLGPAGPDPLAGAAR